MTKPRISVITPTWNRVGYLSRVFNGLLAQTYQNFEWIVADDGSEDETRSLILGLAATSSFPVVLIHATIHIGKARMDNEAIAAASGEFIIWCDSDDYLLPTALEMLIASWDSIPPAEVGKFVGVLALCESNDSILNTNTLGRQSIDEIFIELENKYLVNEDGALFLCADILKQHRFPEVDLVVPESAVWSELGLWRIRTLPIVVKKVEYNAQNCISFSTGMKYSRGRAYSMAISVRHQGCRRLTFRKKIWKTINFFRYCIHGDIDLKTGFILWGGNTAPLMSVACVLPAVLLATKDRLQKKVIKTHIEFQDANKIVEITTSRIKSNLAIGASDI